MIKNVKLVHNRQRIPISNANLDARMTSFRDVFLSSVDKEVRGKIKNCQFYWLIVLVIRVKFCTDWIKINRKQNLCGFFDENNVKYGAKMERYDPDS